MTAYATTNGQGGANFSTYLTNPGGGGPSGDYSYEDMSLGAGVLIGGQTTAISGSQQPQVCCCQVVIANIRY